MATAFIAKGIMKLPNTRHLISRLQVDEALRQFCGWSDKKSVPKEWDFSRAFALFADMELPSNCTRPWSWARKKAG